ncbi:rhodanese-like domain-containing protein 15, chloroplastic [Hevea brasiliensis]|uniref:rhodanese-like domain-containing protein 15, chloroplastic n=1 Tax=Hevea brasiliensis TaxID=3981 RepID=UPI0025D86497|nr:rhodanese-like domain-containing protein 15, chloroplastic [Hevea brasiliensis]
MAIECWYQSEILQLLVWPKGGLRGNLEAVGVPTSVPVRVARELLLAGHRYLNVRIPEEFSAGHVVEATNIPYACRVGSVILIFS